MTFLLITGAGASRNLGVKDQKMPLMGDWSNALRQKLDELDPGLADACLLQPNLAGDEFESALGQLLLWRRVHPLEEKFAGLGGPSPGHLFGGDVARARENTRVRLQSVIEALNTTLYDRFGLKRVDSDRARAAYRALIDAIGDPAAGDLILATTNYDRSYEAGLAEVGRKADAGFRGEGGRAPVLEPRGLVTSRSEYPVTPVLHLHGAVGWYRPKGGTIVLDYYADQPFNSGLGDPVVLYPDPDKDPLEDVIVGSLWDEFDAAVEAAEQILVVGHSLHDRALVRALNSAADAKRVVITYFLAGEDQRMRETVPNARYLQMEIGAKKAHSVEPLREALFG